MTARQIPVGRDAEFRYTDLLPTGQDDTSTRLITTEGVDVRGEGRTFLRWTRGVLRPLTAEARKLFHAL